MQIEESISTIMQSWTAGIPESMIVNALHENKMTKKATTKETTPNVHSNTVIYTILSSDEEITEPNNGITLPKTTTTPLAQSNTVFPIIIISDDEPTERKNDAVTLPKGSRKRRSVAAADGEGNSQRQKPRKINAVGAPKKPSTGYLHFINYRRESLRKEHPTKSHAERIAMISEEWHLLSDNQRALYLPAAKVDKKRYNNELSAFLKENPDALDSEINKSKAQKNNGCADLAGAVNGVLTDKSHEINRNAGAKTKKEFIYKTKASSASRSRSSNSNKDITPPRKENKERNLQNTATTAAPFPCTKQIFTNDFLQHNKHFDIDLRALRKKTIELERKTALLEKHVEKLKTSIYKLKTENNELEEETQLLQIHMYELMSKLVSAFSTIPLPTEPSGAKMENILKYMDDLCMMAASHTHGSEHFDKAKDIIRELDIQIRL